MDMIRYFESFCHCINMPHVLLNLITFFYRTRDTESSKIQENSIMVNTLSEKSVLLIYYISKIEKIRRIIKRRRHIKLFNSCVL